MGTTKICAIVGEVRGDAVDILAVGKAPSIGLRKGVVVNVDATANSIRRAVEDAGSAAGVDIRAAHVGIAGGHIRSFGSRGAVGIRDKEVTEADVEKAIDAAKAVYVPLDREVLHVIPGEYSIDGQEGTLNPVGMSGVRLEAMVRIVTGAVSSVRNLIKCCEKAGLEVVDIILEPIASAHAVLSEEEKNHGVILIDIGGGTTDIAFYENGILKHTSVASIGGYHITNDIAVGLRLPINEAERLKREYAGAVPGKDGNEEIEIMVAGRDKKTIPKKYLTEIVSPRCEELLDIIGLEIKAFGGHERAIYGVVLTGGGAMLNGIDTVSEAILGLPVRVGVPDGIGGLKNIVRDPMYATGVGLVCHASEEYGEGIIYTDLFTDVLNKMKQWVKNIFKVNSAGMSPEYIESQKLVRKFRTYPIRR